MLARLSIRDIVLIDRLDIDFVSGLSRADRRDRRRQVDPARCFCAGAGRPRRRHAGAPGRRAGPGHRDVRTAGEASGACPAFRCRRGTSLILRRVQFTDGRTRAFVNDQPVSVQALQALGAALVEIHGQHDARALVDASTHRHLLDAYGRLEDDAAAVERLWSGAARGRGGRCQASRRDRAGGARSRLAPSRGRGFGQAQARGGRGNGAGRAPHGDDAIREDRGRPSRRARLVAGQTRRCRRWRRRCAAGAPRRAGAGAGRAGGEGTRRGAQCARRGTRPSGARASRRRSRSAGAGAARGAAVCAPRRRTQVQFSGRCAQRAGREIRRRSGPDRRRRRAAGRFEESARRRPERALPRTPRSSRRRARRPPESSTRRSTAN